MEQTERQSRSAAPIGRLLRTFSSPSIISMVVSTLYNIVDRIIIGRGVGYLGNGAANVILPITIIARAPRLMIGDGAAARYGAGKMDRARKTYFGVAGCATAVMVLGTADFQLFPEAIIRIFGSVSALYQAFAAKSLKIFLRLIALNGFRLCTGVFFQDIGKPAQATLVSLFCPVLFLLPALMILSRFLGGERRPVSRFIRNTIISKERICPCHVCLNPLPSMA